MFWIPQGPVSSQAILAWAAAGEKAIPVYWKIMGLGGGKAVFTWLIVATDLSATIQPRQTRWNPFCFASKVGRPYSYKCLLKPCVQYLGIVSSGLNFLHHPLPYLRGFVGSVCCLFHWLDGFWGNCPWASPFKLKSSAFHPPNVWAEHLPNIRAKLLPWRAMQVVTLEN